MHIAKAFIRKNDRKQLDHARIIIDYKYLQTPPPQLLMIKYQLMVVLFSDETVAKSVHFDDRPAYCRE